MSELSQRLASLSPAKRKLLEQRLQQKPDSAEPIAVVGMACRLPGAPNVDAFWRLIVEGRDATGEIPPLRWDADEFYEPTGEVAGKMSSRWGGFVADVDQFDPLFFGITPREAKRMDPQQRLLLEVGWEALEQGGLAPERVSGSATGVFIGIGATDYSKIPAQYADYYQQIDPHVGTGNALSIAANRLSYILDLHGPSLSVDTACSSALVGIHLAIQSLRHRECSAAMAGGVNLILTPETMIAFSKAHMLSPDGHCRPFDARANGYVRGEGCALVVLKRLTDALGDGDNVLAVIRGTAVNQDGRTSGITAPNSGSQRAVIRAALADAGLTTDRVSYIEAHGTGTPLGDPIEVQALGKLFAKSSPDAPPCYMTSVKANIGHTETVSGVAGLIKVILMMQHGQIPAQLHFEKLNPNMSLVGTRLQIPTHCIPWQPLGGSRVAGVSSFGFGGTNAHLVVEEAAVGQASSPVQGRALPLAASHGVRPAKPQAAEPGASEDACPADRPLHVLAISAKTETALQTLAGQYAERLACGAGVPPADTDVAAADAGETPASQTLADFCYSANTGRAHFNHRLAIVAASPRELQERLQAVHDGKTSQGVKSAQVRIALRPKIAMLFTGQGSQYVGMGKALLDTQPVFHQALRQCDELLREHLEVPLLTVLYPQPGQESPLDSTAYTQPALFALEYALAQLWRSWGIEPALVLGHSVGEYVAACIAGVFTVEEGLRLIAGRARLMQQLPPGGLMAAVLISPDRVAAALAPYQGRIAIAAANGPENTVVSGEADAVRAVLAEMQAVGVRTQLLTVSHAFHSPLMEPILDEFEQLAATVHYQHPRIPIVSNVTGQLLPDQPPDADYWRRHLRGTVQFAASMETVAAQELHALLEVGPAPVLLGMGRRCIPQYQAAWLPSLRKGRDDWQTLLESLSELYVLGAKVLWAGFDHPWRRRRVSLPTYPFERTRVWFDGSKGPRVVGGAGSSRGPSLHPLLGSRVPSALETTLFESRLSSAWPKYLVDHQVQGSPVVPAAAYLEQALAAARQAFGPGNHVLENVAIQQAMFLPPGTTRAVQLALAPDRGGECTFETYSTPADSDDPKPRWTMHAVGTLRRGGDQPALARRIDLDAARRRAADVKTQEDFYRRMAAAGLSYGPAFQVLADLRRAERDAVCTIRLSPTVLKEAAQYQLHPCLLDGLLQAMAGIIPLEADGSDSPYTYMPTMVRRLVMHSELTDRMHVYVVRTSPDSGPSPEMVEGDVYLLDDSGRVLVELSAARVQRVGRMGGQQREIDVRQWLYRLDWQAQPLTSRNEAKRRPNGHGRADTAQGTWLVFADRQGVGAALAEKLKERGGQCVLVSPEQINPLALEDYQRLLQETFAPGQPPPLGVIHLWSLDTPGLEEAADRALDASRSLTCGSVLQLAKALARSKLAKPPAVWLVTQGAQAVTGAADAASPAQAPVWGMGRVAAMEHAEQRCRLVDLDPRTDATVSAAVLAAELSAGADEEQIAYRGGERFVARLQPAPDALPAEGAAGTGLSVPREGPFRLRLGTPGSFDSLRFEPFARRAPAAGQVEIEVRAAGLNFSDVLKALGLYPGIKDEIVPLGIECSGVITAVGEGVDRFQVGDPVMGVAPYSFASHAITAEYALVRKPDNIADDDAATIPITFLTTYYGLVRLAHLQPGERVLIHAGAGGVGLAAIQIARHIGAEVFATAGSDQKRDFLRAQGVQHVMSSRNLDFADEVLRTTGGRGVDVVLNSLPGDAITKSLSILAAYGRFLEIGKTDIYQNRMIGLLPFQDNLSYFAIDLDRMLRQRPEMIREMFAEVVEYFRQGIYRPLALTQFPIAETVAAFRYMAQRKNIGKVVVSLASRCVVPPSGVEETDDPLKGALQNEDALVRADGTYLITGGLGALGLEVAGWLAARGAKYLALMARRAPAGEAAEKIQTLCTGGVRVAAIRGDVADSESLRAALAQIPADFPPLRGVVHAAGVLDDGLMFNMELAQLERPMAPKVQGAWNLHTATRDAPLDFFALFSSVACVLGSPGQANYAAGNAFLDALAQYRRARGLPAVSINWGPWAGSGMAAQADVSEQVQSRGMGLIPVEKGLELLGGLLRGGAANVAVLDARWGEMQQAMRGRKPALLRLVAAAETAAAETQQSKVDHAFREKLLGVDLDERKKLLREYFAQELARIMGIESASLDVQQPLNTIGLDSLMAIELKNNLEGRLAITLPMAVFLEGPSVTSLADCAAELVTGGPAEATDAAAGFVVPPSGGGATVTGLGDHTVAATPEREEWTPIVTLRRNGASAPLFCFHAVGGDVSCYFELARALADRTVYALRARGLDDELEPHRSLRAMATDYLAAMREVQPEGPYHLAGWSAGGLFAYEVAHLLEEQGTRAGTLMVFDTPLPSIFKNVDPNDDARFLFDLVGFSNRAVASDMRANLEQMRSLDREERFQAALAEAKRQGVLPADVPTERIRRFVEVCRAHVLAIMNYTPAPLAVPLHFVRAMEAEVLHEASGQTLATDLGWGTILEKVVIHEVPGEHFSMLVGENARRLAQVVEECLEKRSR